MTRQIISVLPQKNKYMVTSAIAAIVYWPLARLSKVMNNFGINTSNIPLHRYASMPYVMLANDALDRFGTSLEQRFSKAEITEMLQLADFDISTLKFSDSEPFWTFSVKNVISRESMFLLVSLDSMQKIKIDIIFFRIKKLKIYAILSIMNFAL